MDWTKTPFGRYLKAQIDRAIYVWGGQGDVLSTLHDPEKWIKNQESDVTNRARVITLYRARKAAGVWPIRAFDCSGLITYYLQDKLGVTGDMTAQMLYDRCQTKLKKSELCFGDLVFKGADEKHITHVGVYTADGHTVESQGRDVGVVETELDKRPWNYFGRLDELQPYLEEDKPVVFKFDRPRVKGDAVRLMQLALNEAGYTDDTGAMLETDGSFGFRTEQAFKKMIEACTEPAPKGEPYNVTITMYAPFNMMIDGKELISR